MGKKVQSIAKNTKIYAIEITYLYETFKIISRTTLGIQKPIDTHVRRSICGIVLKLLCYYVQLILRRRIA